MAVSSGQVQLNNSTATQIVAAANSNTIYVGRGVNPRTVVLYNADGTNDAYIGTSAVAAGTGFKLLHGSTITVTLAEGDSLYGLASASTPTVHYLATG